MNFDLIIKVWLLVIKGCGFLCATDNPPIKIILDLPLSFPRKELSIFPFLPLCLPNSSFRLCVPDLNLNKSLLPASHIPCKYFLNSTLLPNHFKVYNLTLVLSSFSNFLLFLSLMHFYTQAINEADELRPCLISSSHSLLSIHI